MPRGVYPRNPTKQSHQAQRSRRYQRKYWGSMTPAERSVEMKRRMAIRRDKFKHRGRLPKTVTTENPFEQFNQPPSIAASKRTLKGLLADLQDILLELNRMFGL